MFKSVKKEKKINMRLQTDTKFEQTKIKDLNEKITLTCSRQMFVVGNHFLPNKKLKNLKNESESVYIFFSK